MSIFSKLFGDYSSREIKRIKPTVDKILAMEDTYAAMTDAQLREKTDEFKERLKNGETTDDILPEAFAVCREASWRVLGMKHFPVQLMGGIILHQGRIAEMKTGEGKTLVATLPAYLNALTGEGVHIVTVNDYLAKRDSEWMGKVYRFLGLSVGLIIHEKTNEERKNAYHADCVVELRKVSIRYGERTILKDLDWVVKRGEKWALSGQNGSGKSTLLSLICADNPQSYACDISLFGRQRGSGESIWEIKKHIGYVSPEMHRAYLKSLPAIDIVASGLHDSVGLYKKVRDDDRAVCAWWMDIFGIADLRDRNFLQLSSGEQRMVLLARAFVKDPELLVLDEPLHGLDMYNRRLVKDVIEAFCRREGKTLIMVTHYEEELPACIGHRLYLTRNV